MTAHLPALAAIERVCETASEGPWRATPFRDQHEARWAEIVAMVGDGTDSWIVTTNRDCGTEEADAEFIALARTAMPALVAFARDVLALCDDRDDLIRDTNRPGSAGVEAVIANGRSLVSTASIRQTLARHLGERDDGVGVEG